MITGRPLHHIGRMQKIHPHAEATYRVISFDDGSFGVEVKIPEAYPTTVSKSAPKRMPRCGSPIISAECDLTLSPVAGLQNPAVARIEFGALIADTTGGPGLPANSKLRVV